MPLKSGPVGSEAFKSNVAELINSGHERAQALAIAYKTARGDETETTDSVNPFCTMTPDRMEVILGALDDLIAKVDAINCEK